MSTALQNWMIVRARLPAGLLPAAWDASLEVAPIGEATLLAGGSVDRQLAEWEAEMLLDEKAKAWEAARVPAAVALSTPCALYPQGAARGPAAVPPSTPCADGVGTAGAELGRPSPPPSKRLRTN